MDSEEDIASYPYHYPDDLFRLDRLLKQCETFVQWHFNPNEIPSDPERARFWVDSRGNTIAVAVIDRPVGVDSLFLRFAVHPSMRGRVEPAIIAWAESVAGRLGQLGFGCHACTLDLQRIRVLEDCGFEPKSDEALIYMVRSLTGSLPAPHLPEGYRLRLFSKQVDMQPWVSLFMETQEIDLSVDERKTWMEYPSYIPDLDLVIIAPDGSLAAYCLSNIFKGEQGEIEEDSAWILWLGTESGHRRKGLARALLQAALCVFQAYGCEKAFLYTWPGNEPTIRLNRSLGFEVVYRMLYYSYAANMTSRRQ